MFFFFLPLLCCAELRADIWPVILVGEPAPGISDARFTSVGQPAVNASGDIAFNGGLDVTLGDVQGAGIFKVSGGEVSPVVLTGQLVPDSSGNTFRRLGDPDINNSGDTAFLAGTIGQTSLYDTIFVKSGYTLRKVVDLSTSVPGMPGQSFQGFGGVKINDAGDVTFAASFNSGGGTFRASSGTLQLIAQGAGLSNNRGDVVFGSGDGIFLSSKGSVTPIAAHGQSISNSSLLVDSPQNASINDNGDIVFVNVYVAPGKPTPNAVVRWHAGVLEKIAATGDPVPGVTGAVLDGNFGPPEINQSGVLFTSRIQIPGVTTQPDVGPIGIIGRFQNGQWSVVARSDQLVEGIGTLDFIAQPNFDKQQGPLLAFVSNYNLGSVVGLYTAMAGQSNLLLPQIADGTTSGGGWRTTFILANRSTTVAFGTVNFYNDNGSPMNVGISGQQQSQFFITIPALGVAQFQTDGVSPLQTGWVRVQADQNLSGTALFGFFDSSGKLLNQVGAPASVPLRSMSIFVESGAATSTGFAFANPGSTPASVTLILRDSNSIELGRTSFTIPVMGHIAKYVGEIFSSISLGQFDGKLEVISTQPLAALTLRQQETVFTSLPVIP